MTEAILFDANEVHDLTDEDKECYNKEIVVAHKAKALLAIKFAKVKVSQKPNSKGDYRLSLGVDVLDPKTQQAAEGGPGRIFLTFGIAYRNLSERNGGSPSHLYSDWTKRTWNNLVTGAFAEELGIIKEPKNKKEADANIAKILEFAKDTLRQDGQNLLTAAFVATMNHNPYGGRMGYELTEISDDVQGVRLTPVDQLFAEFVMKEEGEEEAAQEEAPAKKSSKKKGKK